jgi:6-pyruvoyltetrahydropterin/6-carboxytetrahydropterin synthase
MYTVSVETTFSAAHRLRLQDGTVEQQHRHEWHVRVHFARAELDENGMVIDFAVAQATLNLVVAELHGTNLNAREPLAGKNPTAETLARHIFERLCDLGLPIISRVEVAEAPGCVAVYEPARDLGMQNTPVN